MNKYEIIVKKYERSVDQEITGEWPITTTAWRIAYLEEMPKETRRKRLHKSLDKAIDKIEEYERADEDIGIKL